MPRVENAMKMLLASLLAHLAVVAWVVFPDPLEQLTDKPELVLLEMLPPFRCPDFTWIEHRSGCVVTREAVCKPRQDEEAARRARR